MPSRVVIVDDHARFRRVATLMLREGGFAGSAADAFRLANDAVVRARGG